MPQGPVNPPESKTMAVELANLLRCHEGASFASPDASTEDIVRGEPSTSTASLAWLPERSSRPFHNHAEAQALGIDFRWLASASFKEDKGVSLYPSKAMCGVMPREVNAVQNLDHWQSASHNEVHHCSWYQIFKRNSAKVQPESSQEIWQHWEWETYNSIPSRWLVHGWLHKLVAHKTAVVRWAQKQALLRLTSRRENDSSLTGFSGVNYLRVASFNCSQQVL